MICKPRTSKRFRPHLFRRLEAGIPRKSLDISSIRKKTPAKPPRQRATSFGSLQLSHGKFGAVCRKMFGQQRRRKSFSMSSKSSSFDSDIADPMISTATEEEGGQSSTQSNNNGIQQQKGCSHEATSPEVPNYPIIENGEVDELAEYFEHFVNVHRKMSELAESMYV
uniref:Oxidative stress-responsive serine-rich protein 1 n=1 Tax=Panagrolaimus superbus TaxID=310955 RepID=A0A914YGA9_9BILA